MHFTSQGVSAAVPANPVIPGAHLSPVFMCPVPATPCIPDPHPPVSSVHVLPPPGQTNAPSPVASPSPPEAPNVLVTTSQEGTCFSEHDCLRVSVVVISHNCQTFLTDAALTN